MEGSHGFRYISLIVLQSGEFAKPSSHGHAAQEPRNIVPPRVSGKSEITWHTGLQEEQHCQLALAPPLELSFVEQAA